MEKLIKMLNFMRIKRFCDKRCKKNKIVIDWKKVFVKDIFYRGLFFKLCKYFLKFSRNII